MLLRSQQKHFFLHFSRIIHCALLCYVAIVNIFNRLISGSTAVIPVVAQIKNFSKSELVWSKDEVADVFVKGVYDLHNPKVAGYTQFRIPDKPGYSLPIYNCDPYPIWGMTAIMTYQFLSVLLRGRSRGFRHKLQFQSPLNLLNNVKTRQ